MGSETELEQELQTLDSRWSQITEIPETPHSLMGIIEYSLGSQRKAEVYVNRLLRYFLDPDEPHGMGTDFLRAFLEGLPEGCGFDEDTYDLSDIQVEDQVRVSRSHNGDRVSTGEVDLVLAMPNEWFLLVELKFSAGENNLRGDGPSQTENYFQATHIDDQRKETYETGHYYLYIHPDVEPRANDPHFTNWAWEALTREVLRAFIVENTPRYPQRTAVQLHELYDDIQGITGMTTQDENTAQKVELYLEHFDAIKDVTDTFDDRWNSFTNEWGALLGEALARDEYGSYSNFDEDLTAVELNVDDEAFHTWKFRTGSSDWGTIFKDGWWRHTDDLAGEIYARPDDRNDVRIGFHHRLKRNRDLAVGEGILKFYFRNMGANDQAFIDAFNDEFSGRQEAIEQALPPATSVTGNKRDMLVATYDIETDAHDDFFEAYIAALEQAFVEHVVANEQLLMLLDSAYRDALEHVYGVSVK
ncbi:PD-(D/E)XK nuclease family protein [Natrononativus amylolyticus]|uniref:PD-(D/E)XK nuclease family protein n=1 Tax=Natrononativus amylolyticus TaxID=2963434 RepID=UPI0020CDAC58|nr:PD-(D/E)XK nuclease family protein [Natrononativus amylolyticus]